MLFDPVVDLFHRMAGETVAAAVGHCTGIGTVAIDAGEHRFVTEVCLNLLFQCGMAGKAITGTGEKRDA